MTPGRLRVLIVDDHPGVVKSISRLLACECDVVGSASDCGGLIDAAQRLEPDVIVVDVNLPDGDGLKACREILRGHPRTKVVVFTAADDPNVERRAFEAGASAFVHKLGSGGGLLSAVRNLGADPAT
jgi:DNA-binding NarL/FixJ family response regulator